jgi:hypothetical protein
MSKDFTYKAVITNVAKSPVRWHDVCNSPCLKQLKSLLKNVFQRFWISVNGMLTGPFTSFLGWSYWHAMCGVVKVSSALHAYTLPGTTWRYYAWITYWKISLNPSKPISTHRTQHATAVLFAVDGLRNVNSLLRSNYVVQFPTFCGPRRFTALSKQPTAGSFSELDESSSHHARFSKSVLIIFSHLHPSLPRDFVPAGFRSRTSYTFLLSPTNHMP